MKYRYIINSSAVMTDKACQYELHSGNNLSGLKTDTAEHMEKPKCAIRIEIPDNMTLESQGNGVSTTSDARTLKELHAVPVIRMKSGWKKAEWLAPFPIHRWIQALMDADYFPTNFGFMTEQTYYRYLSEMNHTA